MSAIDNSRGSAYDIFPGEIAGKSKVKAFDEPRNKIEGTMTRVLRCTVITMAVLISFSLNGSTMAGEDIYGLRIENINRSGADFYWSTAVESRGSIEYAYTKLAQLYNPESLGSQQSVLITVVPTRVKSEPHYVKDHHIRLDDLDMYYAPIVQYTIKSETSSGVIYTISGELVLVDTGVIPWWQTSWFTIGLAISMLVLGLIIRPIGSRIRKDFQSRRAKNW